MDNNKQNKLEERLRIDFKANSDDLWLSNGLTLRKLIGALGMLLPVLLWLTVLIDSGHSHPLESISHYYYTRAGSVLTIIVGLLAIFLIIYKDKDRTGFYASLIAGVFALLLLLFPTDNIIPTCHCLLDDHVITFLKDADFRVKFHLISAAIFLLTLAFMSYYVFTKPNPNGLEVKPRNKIIYKICAIVIVASIIFIGISFTKLVSVDFKLWYHENHLTFLLETIAIEFFGISWLTKGGALQKDKSCV